MRNSSQLTPEEYNEPVYYCKSCHSLCIVVDGSMADADWDGSYCGKCYSANVGVCAFGKWLEEEEDMAEKRRAIEWRK